MRIALLCLTLASPSLCLAAPQENGSASPWDTFIQGSEASYGALGRRAAEFLAENRGPMDDEFADAALLNENLTLALEARERFPWCAELTEERFFNDVLPYAVLDERRENWRPGMLRLTAPIVEGATSIEEAAQRINARLFDRISVHYNTGRKKPNASPAESIGQGRATCTGLTILYVDACRSVGIPARAAGVFRWHDDRGNHTWPEVWDGKRWRFTGADEFDPNGMDRGWFTVDAAQATADDRKHAVWATSWRKTGKSFPLVWNRDYRGIAAVNVTERYAKGPTGALAELGAAGEALGEEASQRLVQEAWEKKLAATAAELGDELENQAFTLGEHTLGIKERTFGIAPDGGHSLWISMHGGGGTKPETNDRQWENQIKLYEPSEGIYVAPRAPTDTWNLWHQEHIDGLFDRMIAAYVACRGVNPNRVYLMGYSAGGDGVYQLAPRMADRFAAAAMMAGHPNETKPDSLRNLPFALFMGGEDASYDRNKEAARWRTLLGTLRVEDPEGYEHRVTIYPGKGHWMDGEDKEALPWMANHTRDPWPSRVVWLQDDVRHTRFYWLELKGDQAARHTSLLIAEVSGQSISIRTESEPQAGPDEVTLHLLDRLIDLDAPITVSWNGTQVFSGMVERTREAVARSSAASRSKDATGTAILTVERDV